MTGPPSGSLGRRTLFASGMCIPVAPFLPASSTQRDGEHSLKREIMTLGYTATSCLQASQSGPQNS